MWRDLFWYQQIDMFCENRSSFGTYWVNHGINHCFIDTLSSGVIGGFVFIFGFSQVLMYRKYSNNVPAHHRPKNVFFQFQIILTIALIIESITRMIVQFYLQSHILYGYQILLACVSCVCFLLSLVLIYLERCRNLPSIPAWGHGLVLLVLWTLYFVRQNLDFISWKSRSYWWQNKT